MKYELTERLVLAIEKAVDEGRKSLLTRASLVAQAMCSAEIDHNEHDEEDEPTVH